MSMKVRGYEGDHDLAAMLDLLSVGQLAQNGTYYIHRGDLQWWLFYTDVPQEKWQSNIRLWMQADKLLGWTLLSPEENAFDVFTMPALRGDARESEMLTHAVAELSVLDKIRCIWIAMDDQVRIDWLEANKFTNTGKAYLHFERSLLEPFDDRVLPNGFTLRHSRGPQDAQLRSIASHAAFGSKKTFDEYWPRTLRFMQSSIYIPDHEIFIIAPEGEVAAYCIIWADEQTRMGHFEPVGTHPDFQKRGLGKSLLYEALRQLKSEGMTSASVCTQSDNFAAIRLYESVGFQNIKKLLTYEKSRI